MSKNKIARMKAWSKAWAELRQERIQVWIEAIYKNVQEVIPLHRGNDYKERPRSTMRQYKD